MKQILMIEEDEKIAVLVGAQLKENGCALQHASRGAEGLSLALAHAYDLIVLDQELPDMPGTDICHKLRQQGIRVPVMMLTTHPADAGRISESVDDHLVKPFSITEFIARVKAILRRTEQPQQDDHSGKIERGGLHMDLVLKKVTLNDEPLELSFKEFELLQLFMANPGRSYTREQLLSEVWGHAFAGFEHVVNSHINRLRAKVEKDTAHPEYILTTWGVGFRFTDTY